MDWASRHCSNDPGFDIGNVRVTIIDAADEAVSVEDAKKTKVFSDDDDDDYIRALLDVAQSQIDGPDAWLGRSIGLQTLQISVPAYVVIDTIRLPLPPYVETVSDVISVDGVTRTFQWDAGYGSDPAKPLPAAVKHAIIMMAGVLRDATPDEGGALKRQTVEGVGVFDYGVPDGGAAAMKAAAENLLGPYKVFRP